MRLIALFALVMLSGCSMLTKTFGDSAYSGYGAAPIDKAALASNQLVAAIKDPAGLAVPDGCFKVPVSDEGQCATARNGAMASIGLASDTLCEAHMRTIYGNEAAFNITAGSFTNLFAGAASVVQPQVSKSVLAALALFSNSERSLVNETVYKQMLVPAIVTKINEARTAKAAAIRGHFKQTTVDYPITQALWDMSDYHNACSFMNGLQAALRDGTTDAATKQIQQLKADMTVATLEMAAIPVNDRDVITGQAGSGKRKAEYDAIADRYKALNDKLKTLQTQ